MRRTSLQWIAGIAVLFVVSVGLTQAWAGWFSVAWDATTTDIYGRPVTALVEYHLCWQDSAGGAQCLDVGNQTTYPLTDLPGNLTYTLWVTASDSAGNVSGPSDTLTVPVPLAQPDTASTPVGTPVVIDVRKYDIDPWDSLLQITTVTQGIYGGTVDSSSTSVTYTPPTGFIGTDSFTYTITNGRAFATGTVTVTVTSVTESVLLEAEAGTLLAPMQVGTDTAAPAVQYVWVPSGTPNILDPMQAGGVSYYSFLVDQTDSYVVWGRVSLSTTGTGSFFLGLDAPAGNGLIADISPTDYQVATLHVGSTYYIDTTTTIKVLPSGWDGLEIIKTADAAKRNKQATFLTFTLLQDATLYVAYDASVSDFPRWLKTSFTNTGQHIQTTNSSLALWRQHVPAGPVVLPGNKYQMTGPVRSQYVVVVAPYFVWDVTPPPAASASPQAWRWEQAASVTTPVFLLDPGLHTLTIRQRESGTRLDKLVITNNLTLVPQP